jgi:hypothetical protein
VQTAAPEAEQAPSFLHNQAPLGTAAFGSGPDAGADVPLGSMPLGTLGALGNVACEAGQMMTESDLGAVGTTDLGAVGTTDLGNPSDPYAGRIMAAESRLEEVAAKASNEMVTLAQRMEQHQVRYVEEQDAFLSRLETVEQFLQQMAPALEGLANRFEEEKGRHDAKVAEMVGGLTKIETETKRSLASQAEMQAHFEAEFSRLESTTSEAGNKSAAGSGLTEDMERLLKYVEGQVTTQSEETAGLTARFESMELALRNCNGGLESMELALQGKQCRESMPQAPDSKDQMQLLEIKSRFEQEIANSQAERMQERAELLARIERLEQQPLDTQLSSSTILPSRVEALEQMSQTLQANKNQGMEALEKAMMDLSRLDREQENNTKALAEVALRLHAVETKEPDSPATRHAVDTLVPLFQDLEQVHKSLASDQSDMIVRLERLEGSMSESSSATSAVKSVSIGQPSGTKVTSAKVLGYGESLDKKAGDKPRIRRTSQLVNKNLNDTLTKHSGFLLNLAQEVAAAPPRLVKTAATTSPTPPRSPVTSARFVEPARSVEVPSTGRSPTPTRREITPVMPGSTTPPGAQRAVSPYSGVGVQRGTTPPRGGTPRGGTPSGASRRSATPPRTVPQDEILKLEELRRSGSSALAPAGYPSYTAASPSVQASGGRSPRSEPLFAGASTVSSSSLEGPLITGAGAQRWTSSPVQTPLMSEPLFQQSPAASAMQPMQGRQTRATTPPRTQPTQANSWFTGGWGNM